jgi:hypothetical protein
LWNGRRPLVVRPARRVQCAVIPERVEGASPEMTEKDTPRLGVLNRSPDFLRRQRRVEPLDAEFAQGIQSTDIPQHGFDRLALVGGEGCLWRDGIADVIALDRKPCLDAGGEIVAGEGFVDAP